MNRAIVVSCNAYFAQLGTYKVGPEQLLDTAKLIGISVANPADCEAPEAADAAGLLWTRAGGGVALPDGARSRRDRRTQANCRMGRWIIDDSNSRTDAPKPLLPAPLANLLAKDMRGVVTSGTGKRLAAIKPAIAGKTGTAELANAPSHAWFIGFAPYAETPAPQRIAFSILAENGHYGGTAAAPMAGDLVIAAQQLHLIP